MKNPLRLAALLAVVSATAAFAQTPPTTPPTPPTTPPPANSGRGTPHTVNENASERAKAVQESLKKFDAQRDELAAKRKALLDQLAGAKTEDERKVILEQLRTEQKARAEELRALGKEVRDELKKTREQRKTGTN